MQLTYDVQTSLKVLQTSFTAHLSIHKGNIRFLIQNLVYLILMEVFGECLRNFIVHEHFLLDGIRNLHYNFIWNIWSFIIFICFDFTDNSILILD